MTVSAAARNFVEDPVFDEAAEDFPQRRNRCQGFSAVTPRVDDFQIRGDPGLFDELGAFAPRTRYVGRLGRQALLERL